MISPSAIGINDIPGITFIRTVAYRTYLVHHGSILVRDDGGVEILLFLTLELITATFLPIMRPIGGRTV